MSHKKEHRSLGFAVPATEAIRRMRHGHRVAGPLPVFPEARGPMLVNTPASPPAVFASAHPTTLHDDDQSVTGRNPTPSPVARRPSPVARRPSPNERLRL